MKPHSKASQRKHFIQKRRAIAPLKRQQFHQSINQHLISRFQNQSTLKNNTHIYAYLAMSSEVNLSAFILWALENNQPIFLPVIEDNAMRFQQVSASQPLLKHPLGFWQPCDDLAKSSVLLEPFLKQEMLQNFPLTKAKETDLMQVKGDEGHKSDGMNDISKPSIACLTPLTAVDKRGIRMGLGGGYYDRFFAHHNDNKNSTICKIAVCYHCQVSPQFIQKEPHDAVMDELITQEGWGKFSA